MNSFDFNQSPQPALIEPANFVGPAPETTTTTTTMSELNPIQTYLILALVVAVAAIVPAYMIGRRTNRT